MLAVRTVAPRCLYSCQPALLETAVFARIVPAGRGGVGKRFARYEGSAVSLLVSYGPLDNSAFLVSTLAKNQYNSEPVGSLNLAFSQINHCIERSGAPQRNCTPKRGPHTEELSQNLSIMLRLAAAGRRVNAARPRAAPLSAVPLSDSDAPRDDDAAPFCSSTTNQPHATYCLLYTSPSPRD